MLSVFMPIILAIHLPSTGLPDMKLANDLNLSNKPLVATGVARCIGSASGVLAVQAGRASNYSHYWMFAELGLT